VISLLSISVNGYKEFLIQRKNAKPSRTIYQNLGTLDNGFQVILESNCLNCRH